MTQTLPTRHTRKGEQGYALVLIMFFLALLVLSTIVAAPTVIANIQREKEKEMVWRGKQYTRAIRMYYAKMKRYPTSLDDLTKPKTGLRFMRQAYKDPMNPVDGSWRLIYVGPNGQLIGSLNPQSQQTFGVMPGVQQALGMAQNTSFGASASSLSSSFGSSFGNTAFGGGTATSTASPAPGTGNPTDPNAQNSSTSSQMGTPQPLAMMDSSNTIGGNIIGVGSKINKASFLWYKKAKNYQLFEFIWDPSKDTGMGGASRGIGTPVQNMNTTNPSGIGAGLIGGTNSGQNPQQNQNLNPISNPPLQAPPNQ